MTSNTFDDGECNTWWLSTGRPPRHPQRPGDQGFFRLPHVYKAPLSSFRRRRFNGTRDAKLDDPILGFLIHGLRHGRGISGETGNGDLGDSSETSNFLSPSLFPGSSALSNLQLLQLLQPFRSLQLPWVLWLLRSFDSSDSASLFVVVAGLRFLLYIFRDWIW